MFSIYHIFNIHLVYEHHEMDRRGVAGQSAASPLTFPARTETAHPRRLLQIWQTPVKMGTHIRLQKRLLGKQGHAPATFIR